ncbi:hypothetical protein ACF3DV_13675 [Chlorogloeopsis fritschii PCC 9212]|uniref:Uncharacterized protein n=1 Tax=Chlorogloeopsis fritschii PCC 6912 TaxID=211165 RepID=A0A3S0Y8S6_CHLFR|nr:hypothetical protein [Chlorogloeopsis fritschii]RUR86787.1 hypothetical protein PCC6912_02300 [Chlorogloeopsis fritschii PCC 6912]
MSVTGNLTNFPGLDLPIAALLAGDLIIVLTQVQRNIATEAHQVFVEQLAQRRSHSVSI